MHAVGIENCPRCLLKDRTSAPLSLKVFTLPDSQSAASGEIEPDAKRQPEPQEDIVSA
jgi:hypothetical protein